MGLIRGIGAVLLLTGLVLLVGAIGFDDYMVSLGINYPLYDTVFKMGVSFCIILAGVFVILFSEE